MVNRQLARHLPHDLLAAAGLLAEPPYCTVSRHWIGAQHTGVPAVRCARHTVRRDTRTHSSLGLMQVVWCLLPLCPAAGSCGLLQVSLPPSDAGLLVVTSQDIARLPAAIQAAADAAAAPPAERTGSQTGDISSSSMRLARASSDGSRAAAVGSSSGQSAGARAATLQPTVTPRAVAPSMLASTAAWLPRGGSADPAASGMTASVAPGVLPAAAASGPADLAVENARLRAELAGLLAQQAAKELGEDLAAAAAGPAGAGGGAASQLLAASVSASMSVAASTAATAAAAGGGSQQAAAAAEAAGQRPYGHGGVPVVPPCVTAPLPSVMAALQQTQESAAGAASVAASQRALTLGPVKVSSRQQLRCSPLLVFLDRSLPSWHHKPSHAPAGCHVGVACVSSSCNEGLTHTPACLPAPSTLTHPLSIPHRPPLLLRMS